MKSTINGENLTKDHVSFNPDPNVKVVDDDLFNTFECKLSYPSVETASSDESQETTEELSTQEAEYLKNQCEAKVYVKLKQEEYVPDNDYSAVSVELKETVDEKEHTHHHQELERSNQIAIDDAPALSSASDIEKTDDVPTETLTATPVEVVTTSTKKKDSIPQAPFYYIVISSDEEDEVETNDTDSKHDEKTKEDDNDNDTKNNESEDDIDKLFHYDDYHDLFRGLSFTPEPQPPRYNFDDEDFDVDEELDRLYEIANRKPEIIVLSDDDEDEKVIIKQEKNLDLQPPKSSYKFQFSDSKREADDDDDFQEMLQLPASTQKRLKSSSTTFT